MGCCIVQFRRMFDIALMAPAYQPSSSTTVSASIPISCLCASLFIFAQYRCTVCRLPYVHRVFAVFSPEACAMMIRQLIAKKQFCLLPGMHVCIHICMYITIHICTTNLRLHSTYSTYISVQQAAVLQHETRTSSNETDRLVCVKALSLSSSSSLFSMNRHLESVFDRF